MPDRIEAVLDREKEGRRNLITDFEA